MRGAVALVVIACFAILASTASAAATLTFPMNVRYNGTIPFGYTLSTTPASGTVQIAITGETTTTLTLAGAVPSNSFTVPAANLTATGPIQSVGGATSLPDGTYYAKVTYEDASTSVIYTSATKTFIVGDGASPAPILTGPAAGSATSSPVAVAYTLPLAQTTGTVSLTFVSSSVTRTLQLAMSTAGVPVSFNLNPANPTSSPEVLAVSGGGSTIPDGTYAVTLSYEDTLGGTAASASSSLVTIDTVTQLPALASPSTGDMPTGTIPVTFTLPETPLSGSVQLTFAGASTYVLALADTTSGQHSLTVDPTDPLGSADVQSMAGGSAIAPGRYSVSLTYQDALDNPAATTNIATIAVSPCQPGFSSATGFAPCLAAPAGDFVTGSEATTPVPCPAGSYQSATGSAACLPTPAGNYTPAAATAPVPCPAGAYCAAQATAPTECPAGTFNPNSSSDSATACGAVPAGRYAGIGSAAATPCPAGAACLAGSAAPQLCSAGSYAASAGSAVCSLAAPGSYVAEGGAAAELLCPAGSFNPVAGASHCAPAPAGSYAPAGATAAVLCPAGTSTTAPGQAACTEVSSAGRTSKVVILRVTRLRNGRIRLRLRGSSPGTFSVILKLHGRRRGAARTRTAARAAQLTISPSRLKGSAKKWSVWITVTFRPTAGGPPIIRTRHITLRRPSPHRARRRA